MTAKLVKGIIAFAIVVFVVGVIILVNMDNIYDTPEDTQREYWWQTMDVQRRFKNDALQRYYHIQMEIHKWMDTKPLDSEFTRLGKTKEAYRRALVSSGIHTLHVMCLVNHDYYGASLDECTH